MLKELSKPKRGAEFIIKESNDHVWLYRIKGEKTYTVSRSKTFDKVFNINPAKLKAAPKLRNPIGNKIKPLSAEEKKVKNDLNEFYRIAAFDVPFNCQECGELLDVFNDWDARCVTAHILPKSKESGFPSIACHAANRLFLGKKNCCCHDRYDKKGAQFRSTMKIYPSIILPAFEILKQDLSEHDIIRAKKYLNIK